MTEKEKNKLDVFIEKFGVHFPDDPDKGIYGKLNEIKTEFLQANINLVNRVKIVEDRLNSRHLMKLMVAGGFVSVCTATVVAIIKNFILK